LEDNQRAGILRVQQNLLDDQNDYDVSVKKSSRKFKEGAGLLHNEGGGPVPKKGVRSPAEAGDR